MPASVNKPYRDTPLVKAANTRNTPELATPVVAATRRDPALFVRFSALLSALAARVRFDRIQGAEIRAKSGGISDEARAIITRETGYRARGVIVVGIRVFFHCFRSRNRNLLSSMREILTALDPLATNAATNPPVRARACSLERLYDAFDKRCP